MEKSNVLFTAKEQRLLSLWVARHESVNADNSRKREFVSRAARFENPQNDFRKRLMVVPHN